VPDATTLLKFRRLLEQHDLTAAILAEVNAHLSERGLLMRQGTVVDATIIAAPSSTKNEDGKRDPEMHQAKKGNQWHFGMKMHIGVDAESGLIHSVVCTAANEADVVHGHELLHGQESQVHGDSGYTGLDKRDEITAAQERRPAAQGHRLAHRHEARPDSRPCPKARQGTARVVRAAQGAGAGHRRAPVPRHQEPVRLPQGQLPRHRQERGSGEGACSAGQPVHRQAPIDGPRGQCVCSMTRNPSLSAAVSPRHRPDCP
jgi:IS5 family transposase